jgi:hypothetical protein
MFGSLLTKKRTPLPCSTFRGWSTSELVDTGEERQIPGRGCREVQMRTRVAAFALMTAATTSAVFPQTPSPSLSAEPAFEVVSITRNTADDL